MEHWSYGSRARCDVRAFGVVLTQSVSFQAVTGNPPQRHRQVALNILP
jgi:hypothetical protein